MKQLGYVLVKSWATLGLFCYFRKIKVVGSGNIPLGKPILLLSNHQNALMDVLLIATKCNRKPWFLTRSDVFKSGFLRPIFKFLQMLPVYRIRDGKANLQKNKAIFEKCAQLLNANECILLFPEANHSLKRRVRPLSKGFTRIINSALEKNPNLDLQLVPVGQNYQNPTQVGDSIALYFGKPIAVQDFMGSADFVGDIKQKVYESLQELTTHIPEADYEQTISKLENNGTDFLNPVKVNQMLSGQWHTETRKSETNPIFRAFFRLWNLPFIFLWRILLKTKVPEPEFEATFRFGFVLLGYPIFYLIGFFLLWNGFSATTACLSILGHAAVNILLIKIGVTSSLQRR